MRSAVSQRPPLEDPTKQFSARGSRGEPVGNIGAVISDGCADFDVPWSPLALAPTTNSSDLYAEEFRELVLVEELNQGIVKCCHPRRKIALACR
jgi:hypothetical protein